MSVPTSNIHTNLNRIIGQVQGIQKMLDDERDCLDIVYQIAAARSALGRVARELLSTEASACVQNPHKQEDFDKLLKMLFEVN